MREHRPSGTALEADQPPASEQTQTMCLRKIRRSLAADSEAGDERLVTLGLGFLKIVQKPAAFCHQSQQTAPRMEILRVGPEVLLKLKDSLAQKGNLDFGRPHVVLLPPVFADYFLLNVCRQSHA